MSKNYSEKMRAKRGENVWIYKRFLGQFGKKKNKKNHPTDRPLFGICSPVEQGFFFRGLIGIFFWGGA